MAFRNHVDTMIKLVKQDDRDKNSPVLFCSEKSRDDEPFETIKFEMKQVVLYTDEKTLQTITSRVAIEITKLEITNQAEEQEEKDITAMLDILAFHKRLSTNKWKDLCKAQVPVRQFNRLMKIGLFAIVRGIAFTSFVTCAFFTRFTHIHRVKSSHNPTRYRE